MVRELCMSLNLLLRLLQVHPSMLLVDISRVFLLIDTTVLLLGSDYCDSMSL